MLCKRAKVFCEWRSKNFKQNDRLQAVIFLVQRLNGALFLAIVGFGHNRLHIFNHCQAWVCRCALVFKCV